MVEGAAPFGQQLRRLREAAGLTQAELAERAGISEKAVGALESGRRQRPYPSTIRALADALELSDADRATLSDATRGRSRPSAPATGDRPVIPTPPTAIVGRERELAEIAILLDASPARMFTLTGPGGVGKTRLALEIAARTSATGDRRVAFVPLAPVTDASLALPTIAQVLGLVERGDSPSDALLASYLGNDSWLLVLDNLEHLLGVAPQLAELLAACPATTMLVTSRAPLRIRAEHEYPVRPLALPEMIQVPTLADVASASSVQLFLERARAAVPDFELTQANCAAVATICRRLDGLPLALELVAARVRALSPTELLARLDRVLPLLTGGSRDLPERQQTMQAAINWSYELLNPEEQVVFRRLSVFHGGWTLEAAESIAGWGEVDPATVVELLSALVEQSLVIAGYGDDEATRYRMLVPVREFAVTRVEEAGEAEELADRHLEWCLALAREAARELTGAAQHAWLDRLEREHDNIRAALAWAQLDASRKPHELALAASLWLFWETRGYITEGRRWLRQALAGSTDAPAALRADAHNAAGNLARDQGDQAESAAMHAASLAIRRELGDRDLIGQSLMNLGNVYLDQSRYEGAADLYAEALEHFRATDNSWDMASALNNLGIVKGFQGEYQRAAAFLEEALLAREDSGEAVYRARSLDALGVVMQRQGDLERAEELHNRALVLRRGLADKRGLAITLKNLGQVLRYRGDYAGASELIEESLRLRREIEDRFGAAQSLAALAAVARARGETDRAMLLYREALAIHRQVGASEGLPEVLLGIASSAAADQPARAARWLGASEAIRAAVHQPLPPVDRPEFEHTKAALTEALGPQAFDRLREAGRTLSVDEVVADALDPEPQVAGGT